MQYEHLLLERQDDGVAVVTFNRPKKANALSQALLAEIEHVARAFHDDGETRVVVFIGAGRHFTSGADLSDRQARKRASEPLVLRRRYARLGERAIRALWGMDQITIAAWDGAAMGGGACIATALDFRIGSNRCFMSYPEIDIGVPLMWSSLPLLTHLVGPARAKRLVISGQRHRAETLLEWGVLDEMVEPERLQERVLEVARSYAAKAPVPAQMIKRSVNRIVSALDEAIMHMDFDQHALAGGSEDAAEARASYREKRPPRFSGN